MMDESARDSRETPVNDRWRWVSTARASEVLGLSTPTLRRRISDQKPIRLPDGREIVLVGEREDRAQGTAFRIRLPADLADGKADASDASEPGVTDTPDASSEPGGELAPDLEAMLARLGRMWLQPVLDQLHAAHQVSTAQAEQLAVLGLRLDLEMTRNGELVGERDASSDRIRQLEAEIAGLMEEAVGLRLAAEIAANVDRDGPEPVRDDDPLDDPDASAYGGRVVSVSSQSPDRAHTSFVVRHRLGYWLRRWWAGFLPGPS
jgi:hypothetical protein